MLRELKFIRSNITNWEFGVAAAAHTHIMKNSEQKRSTHQTIIVSWLGRGAYEEFTRRNPISSHFIRINCITLQLRWHVKRKWKFSLSFTDYRSVCERASEEIKFQKLNFSFMLSSTAEHRTRLEVLTAYPKKFFVFLSTHDKWERCQSESR